MVEQMPPKKVNPSDKKILVVDDDDTILAMMKATFQAEGFQVRTARDGRNISAKAAEFKPDLIVTDLMMPGGSGYELLRTMQADQITRKIPVLIITGSHLDKSTQVLMRQEPNVAGFYEKPVRPETLLKHIHKLLNTLSREEERQQQRSQDFPVNFGDVF